MGQILQMFISRRAPKGTALERVTVTHQGDSREVIMVEPRSGSAEAVAAPLTLPSGHLVVATCTPTKGSPTVEHTRCAAAFAALVKAGPPEGPFERSPSELALAGAPIDVPDDCELKTGNRISCEGSGLLWFQTLPLKGGKDVKEILELILSDFAEELELAKDTVKCRLLGVSTECRVMIQRRDGGVVARKVVGVVAHAGKAAVASCTTRAGARSLVLRPCDQVLQLDN